MSGHLDEARRERTAEAALTALGDLIATARTHGTTCEARHLLGSAQSFYGYARTLDAARTRLIQNPDSLPEAWAYVDAGRLTIARHLARLGRRV